MSDTSRWAFCRKHRSSEKASLRQQIEWGFDAPKLNEHATEKQQVSAHTPLVLPRRWGPAQVQLALRYLGTVHAERRQVVIDELEGRMEAVRYGAAPVFNELRFLNRLCEAIRTGDFDTNLGEAIRLRREQAEVRRRTHQPPLSASSKLSRKSHETAMRALDELRRQLGATGSCER